MNAVSLKNSHYYSEPAESGNRVPTREELYEPISLELEQVRLGVNNLWTEAVQFLNGKVSVCPIKPGKLLRPAICLLSAGAIGAQDLMPFVPLATAVEILHMAALLHDDVIDSATLRRGEKSFNVQWNDRVAIIGGDYLVARSLDLMTSYNSPDIVRRAVESIRQMTESELLVLGNDNKRFTEADCISVAEKKTGSLFALASAGPAHLLEDAFIPALNDYGRTFGTAFQVIDDILDLVQPPSVLGKPACSDLIEGKNTLPIQFLSEALSSCDAERLASMKDAELSENDRLWVATQLDKTGARRRAEAIAAHYGELACKALDALPPGNYRTALAGLAPLILTRTA